LPFYNAIQAAKYIGCDPKTVRRMLKRGELVAERTERGWLAIPGGQVEYAKIRWEEEQAKFARPWLAKESIGAESAPSLGMDTRDAMDSIRRLEDRIAQLEEMVAAQAHRIETLEQALSNTSLLVPTSPYIISTSRPEPQNTPLRVRGDAEEAKAQQQAQNRIVARFSVPADLPEGTLHSTDFAEQIGIKLTVFEGWLKNGIRGEQLERMRVPTAREGRYTNYFTPEQAEKARELLRRHGKL